MNRWLLKSFVGLSLALLGPLSFAQTGPQIFNLSGGLFNPNGSPIIQSKVDFKIEVRDKDGLCVLYSEEHLDQDLSSSKGGFSLLLGRGTSPVNNLDPANPTAFNYKLFDNSGSAPTIAGCQESVAFIAGDERLVRVHYDLGTGYVAMTPDVPLTSTAYAMVADSLSGKTLSEIVQVKDDTNTVLTQSNLENIFSSTNYPRLNTLLSSIGNIAFSGNRITNVAAPVNGSDATNKDYADQMVAGKAVDLTGIGPAMGTGKSLVWDATAGKWVAGVPIGTDDTKLPLAGGTMQGSIDMGGYDLNAVGNVNISPERLLQVGKFETLGNEPALTANDAGKVWFNSEVKALRVWDGTAARTQAYLDGSGKLDPAWMPNLPAVDGYSLTNVNAIYLQGRPVLAAAPNAGEILKWNGSGWAPAPDLGMTELTGDISALGSGSVAASINASAVTTFKIADAAVTSAKIAPGFSANLILMTDGVSGSSVTYSTCANEGEILNWTFATGWTCTTVTALAPVTSVAGKTGDVTLNIYDIDGWGTATLWDVGTSARNVVQLDTSARIPAVDGGLLTNVNAERLQLSAISAALPSGGNILRFNSTNSMWEPYNLTSADIGGNITAIAAGVGATGGGTSGTVTVGVDVGTTANKIVQLDGSARIPAVDGGLLTNVSAERLQGRTFASTAPSINFVLRWNGSQWEPAADITYVSAGVGATGGGANGNITVGVDVGTTANKIVQLDGSARIPAVDGGLMTNVNAERLQARTLSAAAPSVGDVLRYNGSTSAWEPYGLKSSDIGGNITVITAGIGATGGGNSGNVTVGVDVGTTANKIVQLDGSARIPAVDGGLMTNVNAERLQTRALSAAAPSGGNILRFNSTSSMWEPYALSSADVGGNITAIAAGVGATGGGISGTVTVGVDVGTTANKIVQLDSSARIPAVDGGLLTNVSAQRLQGRTLAATAPTSTQVLTWNGSSAQWEPATAFTPDGAVSMTGQFKSADGTVAAPGMTFASDLNTGIYRPGSDLLGVATGGSERMRFDATGNVGIGTTSPGYKLDVAGPINGTQILMNGTDISANANAWTVLGGNVYRGTGNVGIGTATPTEKLTVSGNILATGSIASGTQFLGQASDTVSAPSFSWMGDLTTGIWRPAASTVALSTAGTERLRITSTGNVGIGTSSPGAKLHVSAGDLLLDNAQAVRILSSTGVNTNILDLTGTNNLRLGSGTGATGFTSIHSGGGTERIRVDANGNVGIGTTSPSNLLSVAGNMDALRYGINAVGSAPANGIFAPASNTLAFSTSSTEAMRIASGGNVGIGTASPGYKLDVAGPINGTQILMNGTDISANANAWTVLGGNVYRGTGNVGIGTTSPGYKLDVNGDINVSNGKLWVNTAGNSYITNDGSTGIGLYTASNRRLGISGAGVVTVGDSTNNVILQPTGGSVGIGTTSPTSTLQVAGSLGVNGTANFGTTGTNGLIQIYNSTPTVVGKVGAALGIITGGGNGLGLTGNNGDVVFGGGSGGSTETARITNAGNVGIGTSSPGYKLHVAGAINATQLLVNGTDVSANANAWTVNGGNIYRATGNVGIGTTSPTSALQIGSGQVLLPDGTSAAPSLAFSTDTGTGLYRSAAQNIGFAAGGSAVLVAGTSGNTLYGTTRIGASDTSIYRDAAGVLRTPGSLIIDSNVGIGTASPGTKLEVAGSTKVTSATQYQGFFVNNGTNDVAKLIGSSATNDTGALQLLNGGTTNVSISANAPSYLNGGNVGIGTTSPTNKLEIVAGGLADNTSATWVSATPAAPASGTYGSAIISIKPTVLPYGSGPRFLNLFPNQVVDGHGLGLSSGMTEIYTNSSIAFFVRPNRADINGSYTSNEVVRINAAGNVGIGTTSPGYKLHVAGPINATQLLVNGSDVSTNANAWTVSGSNVYRATGNVGIGTASPTYPLEVGGGTATAYINSSSGNARIFLNSASGSDSLISLYNGGTNRWSMRNQGSNNSFVLRDEAASAVRMVVDSSGNVGIGTATPDKLFVIQGQIPSMGGAMSTIRTTGSNNGYGLILDAAGAGNNNFGFSVNGTAKGGFSWDNSRGFIGFVNSTYSTNDFSLRLNGDGSLTYNDGSSGAERFRVQSTGNVGIGTTSPGYKLDVAGPINATQLLVNGSDVSTNANAWTVSGSNIFRASGNVGIGTATPASKLHVSGGQITLDNGQYLSWRNNLNNANVGAILLDTNNDLQFSGANSYQFGSGLLTDVINNRSSTAMAIGQTGAFPLHLRTNNANRVTIDSAGNVGIGTTSPGSNLTIEASGTPSIELRRTGQSHWKLQHTNNGLAIQNNWTGAGYNSAITMDDGLGIGTTPVLSLKYAASGGYRVGVNNTAPANNLSVTGNADFSGNVGIGTTTPSSALDINGAETMRGMAAPVVASSGQGRIYFDSTSGKYKVSQSGSAYQDLVGTPNFPLVGSAGSASAPTYSFSADPDTGWYSPSVGILSASTNGTERIRFDGSGNVGIGTLSPTQKLEVAGTVKATAFTGDGSGLTGVMGTDTTKVAKAGDTMTGALVLPAGSAAAPSLAYTTAGLYSPGASTISVTTAGTERVRVDSIGRVGIGTTAPAVALDVVGDIQYTGMITDVSDRRLKENITPLSSALDRVREIPVYSYTMKSDKKKQVEFGVMAQDLFNIIPELVRFINQDKTYMGVNYIGLIPWSIRAIQEIDRDVASLKAENQDLKRRMDQLEEQNRVMMQQLQKLIEERK